MSGQGLKFRHRETGQEMLVAVKDKYPQLADVHVEGRRVVEVSVEWFIEVVAKEGFFTVDPKEET